MLMRILVFSFLVTLAAAAEPVAPGFEAATASGAFPVDTGVLRGELGPGTHGLLPLTYVPSDTPLAKTPGIYNFYRVFSANHRYVESMRQTPCTTERADAQTVRIHWEAAVGHPYVLDATYTWIAPDTLDLTTEVAIEADMPDFEVFLASYCTEAFEATAVFAQQENGAADFMTAEEHEKIWQMFPRDDDAVAMIQDGRWTIEPSPVDWAIRPRFAGPLAYRRDPASKVAIVIMARPEDCFAVSTPQRGEGHRSMYFSLFGRDVTAGEVLRARTRLVIGPYDDAEIVSRYNAFLESFTKE